MSNRRTSTSRNTPATPDPEQTDDVKAPDVSGEPLVPTGDDEATGDQTPAPAQADPESTPVPTDPGSEPDSYLTLDELQRQAEARGLKLVDADENADAEGEPDDAPALDKWVTMQYPAAARGEMATKLLESADRLGYDQGVVRTVTGGFKVPEPIARELFPSQFEDRE